MPIRGEDFSSANFTHERTQLPAMRDPESNFNCHDAATQLHCEGGYSWASQ